MIEPSENLMARYSVQAANGIVEAKPNTAFEIIVANFGLSPVVLPKGMVIGYATRSPVAIHDLNDCVSKTSSLPFLRFLRKHSAMSNRLAGTSRLTRGEVRPLTVRPRKLTPSRTVARRLSCLISKRD